MKHLMAFLFSLSMAVGTPAWASDACRTLAIHTMADVTVSDGGTFRTESYFRDADHAAIRHLYDDKPTALSVVEGGQGWQRTGAKAALAGEFTRIFALGHQFHALWLHFDDIAEGVTVSTQEDAYEVKQGRFPHGGHIKLWLKKESGHPDRLVQHVPGQAAITVRFGDWREGQGPGLPYRVEIDDGKNLYTYNYTQVEMADTPLDWFDKAVGQTGLDEVDVYRLHRRLLRAHCDGDAAAMAALSTEKVMMASRGEVFEVSQADIEQRFTGVFSKVDYTGYIDLVPPEIHVSTDGMSAWAFVNPLAVGVSMADETPFRDQWAWVMLARKVDGAWRHAGNASTTKVE